LKGHRKQSRVTANKNNKAYRTKGTEKGKKKGSSISYRKLKQNREKETIKPVKHHKNNNLNLNTGHKIIPL